MPTKRINSRQKGKRGELEWRNELRAMGFTARRGQQFAGGGDSPDVVCDDLDRTHAEVKFGVTGMDIGTKLLADALAQARRDRGTYEGPGGDGQTCDYPRDYYVAWKPPRKPWRITFPDERLGVFVTVCGRAEMKQALLKLNGGAQ